MKNAFSRISRTCASLVMGGGLVAGALFAANYNEIDITLPHPVAVGSTILPSGHYVLVSQQMGDEDYFLVRGDHGNSAILQAQPTEGVDAAKTQILFTKDGDVWHFDRLELAGESAGYQFSTK